MSGCSTLTELLSRGADAHDAIRAPGAKPLSFGALRRLVQSSRRTAQFLRHRRGRPRRDRAAERPRNGDRLPGDRDRGDGGAAQPGLSRRRIPFLHVRPRAPRHSSSKRAARRRRWRSRSDLGITIVTLTPAPQRGRRHIHPRLRVAGGPRPFDGRGPARSDGARPAHLRHDLAPEDRAAVAARTSACRRPISPRRSPSRRPIAGSRSCRCSISTG